MNTDYIRVPEAIVENTALKDASFTVALYLCSLQDNGYGIRVKQSTIAEMCGGIKVQSVQNAIDTLVEASIIDCSKKKNKDDSLYTYHYHLICLPDEDCPKIQIKAVKSIIHTQHLDNYNINNCLKSNLLHLYAFCVMLAGNNSKLNISYDDISDDMDVTRGRVIEWLEILCVMGLLRKENNNSKSKERAEDVYYIN